MAFQNNTNRGRVEKTIETRHLIEKSATANRATEAQIRATLAPLTEALARYTQEGACPDIATAAGAHASDLTAGERAALHLANRASTRDLIAALLGRLEAQQAQIDAARIEDVGP